MTAGRDTAETSSAEAPAKSEGHHTSPRREIEMILTRQLAGYLALPMVLVDPSNQVIYFNEPAEIMLGRRFNDGPFPWTARTDVFEFTDEDGNLLAPEELPLSVALRRRQLVHRRLWLHSMDGVGRHVSETAIPLVGNAGRFVGAVAIFTEIESE